MSVINWTLDRTQRFTRMVDDMIKDGVDRRSVFVFEGHKFVLGYAQYLCDYLNKRTPVAPSGAEARRSYERSKGGR